MEFPEISMISNFEAGVNCLHNPSLISRFFSHSAVEKVPQVYSFWKWGALILAILATFSSLIRRIKLLFIYIRKIKPSAEPLLQYLGEDFDLTSDDEDDDDECSSSASSDDEDLSMSYRDQQIDEDFTVAGSGMYFREKGQNRNSKLRRRRSICERFPWSEFTAGKSVVKLWDSIALGLNYEDSCKSVVSMWDLNKEQKLGNFFNGSSHFSSMAVASPAVVLTSEVRDDRDDVVLSAYDTRMSRKTPAICAEWGKSSGKVVGINAGVGGKVYVRNKAAGVLNVGDMRSITSPFESVSDRDDAVLVEDENFHGSK